VVRNARINPQLAAEGSGRWRFRPHPAQLVFGGFAAVAVVGALLLSLPFASTPNGQATGVASLFTAISALCVTGLTVVDTPTYWTPFGQAVILLLIQVGGFGVMTFASFIGIILSRRVSYLTRRTAAAETKALAFDDLRTLVGGVIRTSLLIELVAAVILSVRFAVGYGYSVGESIWLGVFHAISAFNNAGFALFSDSMIGFADDPIVTGTLCVAIVLGGLGFPVLVQLRRHGRTPRLWNMNTRLVLAISATLLVSGWIYITLIEWNNPGTLGSLDVVHRLSAGLFQSVQTRTAGFNSVDIGALHPATLLGMDALMFIGGGPAGTAGGIKVTTFGVLLFIMLAEVRGDGVVNIFGKRLSRAVHRQAISVVLLSVFLVVAGAATIMLVSGLDLGPVLFETVSAFGTVGLSTGITAGLPPVGHAVLIALMFFGRLGPITFATALALRQREILYQLPKERPIIG
jgi:trk system potassium uptake protein